MSGGVARCSPGRTLDAERLAQAIADVKRVVAVQEPLEAKRVQVFLRDLDETRLDFDELRLAAQLVEDLLELGQVLAGVADIELAKRLDMLDRRTLRPLDAHFLEEGLPVLPLARLLFAAGLPVVGAKRTAAHRLQFFGRRAHALDERLGDVVLAGNQLGRGHVLRHDHDNLTADDELVADRIADKLHRLVERDVARRDRLNRLETVRGCIRRVALV